MRVSLNIHLCMVCVHFVQKYNIGSSHCVSQNQPQTIIAKCSLFLAVVPLKSGMLHPLSSVSPVSPSRTFSFPPLPGDTYILNISLLSSLQTTHQSTFYLSPLQLYYLFTTFYHVFLHNGDPKQLAWYIWFHLLNNLVMGQCVRMAWSICLSWGHSGRFRGRMGIWTIIGFYVKPLLTYYLYLWDWKSSIYGW